ncbi:MAG: hypothetical protein OXG27_12995 [Chloroflexi bacterium]|nr:hypothetical protein [Chloroflexota bacterium]
MATQSRFPDVLIVGGALLGGTLGWWLGHPLGVLLGAHVAIIAGVVSAPTKRRLGLALALTFLIQWPFWIGLWFWD